MNPQASQLCGRRSASHPLSSAKRPCHSVKAAASCGKSRASRAKLVGWPSASERRASRCSSRSPYLEGQETAGRPASSLKMTAMRRNPYSLYLYMSIACCRICHQDCLIRPRFLWQTKTGPSRTTNQSAGQHHQHHQGKECTPCQYFEQALSLPSYPSASVP